MINKNLKRMKLTSLGAGIPDPSSDANSRNPGLAIVFQRSATMTASTMDARPDLLDPIGESSSSIRSKVAGLDLEKGKENDQV